MLYCKATISQKIHYIPVLPRLKNKKNAGIMWPASRLYIVNKEKGVSVHRVSLGLCSDPDCLQLKCLAPALLVRTLHSVYTEYRIYPDNGIQYIIRLRFVPRAFFLMKTDKRLKETHAVKGIV